MLRILMAHPLDIICDNIPQLNRDILELPLKKRTGGLVHENYMNGSICKYKDMILLCYRTEQKPYCMDPRIHLVQLDDRLVPCSDNYTLSVQTTKQGWRVDYTAKCPLPCNFQQRAEDPRLCVVGDTLYVFWTDGFKIYYGELKIVSIGKSQLSGMTLRPPDNDPPSKFRLAGAEITKQWIPKPPLVPELLMNPRYDGREKNWTPFSWNGELWIVYCYEPFVLCRLDDGHIKEVVRHEVSLEQWKYGFIKGGTPAVALDDDRMITFFHSTKKMEGASNYYFMGALTFCRKTLKPLQVSRYPLVTPFPDGDKRRNNDLYVIFPAGVIKHDDMYIISYGYNDHSIKLFAATSERLDYNLADICDDIEV